MSFQAYTDNIKTKTGKTPEDFRKAAEKKGLLKPGVKAGKIVAWLKKDFGLGYGHAMAIYATFEGSEGMEMSQNMNSTRSASRVEQGLGERNGGGLIAL
jgi:Domain of unknown function (DUF4287)